MEDLSGAMNDRDGWRESGKTVLLDDDNDDDIFLEALVNGYSRSKSTR